ncbi:acyl-CoA synthetase [Luteolibacter sp. GHJ8]|uniref:Acyl-CoA synthetase n=1 Tax=Luteolibacter rhizosphaerae TaxID=2989719 RepID=A0ABT3G0Q7_9BACT|nr:acyl-CoA synthetase [Luteolibacter rhizosphaerae]MCW1913247.1 acyl-CoA synthetase [Luteolibacter rhizosphaerae]
MLELPLIARARSFENRHALREGEVYRSYGELLDASARIAAALLGGRRDLEEARIAFMAPASFEYVAIQWGIWRAGGIAVPLSVHATVPELAHALGDSDACLILVTRAEADRFASEERALLLVDDALRCEACELPEIRHERRAMILYTSGTTNKPKGAVSTHANLQAQIEALVVAWEWQADDRIPLFLPLHHIHGIINVLGCALWSGALVDVFPRFDPAMVLPRVAAGEYSLFMAVPTIYAKLATQLEPDSQRAVLKGFAAMRLMVSGSAALPASLHRRWAELTSQSLLERYGMTETGMILSNPLHGERRSGSVGQPLPGVEVRLRSETGETITTANEAGEIQVRGPAVFLEYWQLPETSAASFEDGWFRTGDMGIREDGYYRILGRLSVDIIKSGGYKLSALEIEAALLEHPAIRECAVIGLEDDTWGETVAVAAVLEGDLGLEDLQHWSKGRLSSYKLPRRLLRVESLPRNAMGKVAKKEVGKLFR